MGTIHVISYNNNVLSHFYQNDFLERKKQMAFILAIQQVSEAVGGEANSSFFTGPVNHI